LTKLFILYALVFHFLTNCFLCRKKEGKDTWPSSRLKVLLLIQCNCKVLISFFFWPYVNDLHVQLLYVLRLNSLEALICELWLSDLKKCYEEILWRHLFLSFPIMFVVLNVSELILWSIGFTNVFFYIISYNL
jgi:hypothetical protein